MAGSSEAPARLWPGRALLGPLRAGIGSVFLLRIAVALGLLGAWEGAYRADLIDPFFFSAPSLIGQSLQEQFEGGRIWRHISATMREALAGLLLGFIAGTVLAWLSNQQRQVNQLIEPVMVLLNSVPRIVLAPLFIVWFGIGANSKIASAFLLVFVVIYFAVSSGLREVPESLIDRVRMLGGGRYALLRHVYVPSVLVWVFSSMRVTVGFAFTGAVVAEFMAATQGLGYLLNFAQNSYNSSLMMATVVIIMVMIVVLFALLARLEAWLLRWKEVG